MFITDNKERGVWIHLNHADVLASVSRLGGNILVQLSTDKAHELENRLETVLNPKPPEPDKE